MNRIWKKSAAVTLLSIVLLTSAYPVLASDNTVTTEGSAIAQIAQARYSLNPSIEVEIKSILNESTLEGTKLGAVVRMHNTSSKVTRVPEYELRLRTADGVEYTLQSSSKNAKSLQPKAQQELSYLTIIDQSEEIELSQISWVNVDMYVYPKKETALLTLPVDTSNSWKGSNSLITNQTAILKWGETFTLAALNSPIVYRTKDIHLEFVDKKPVTIVQIEASNPAKERQTVPVFTMDGKTVSQVFVGKRVEGAIILEPGEKQYLHMLIPTELGSSLSSLNVLTPEKFSAGGEDKSYSIGRLSILLPDNATSAIPAAAYELGKPMQLDPLNQKIHKSMDVSLVELHIKENDADGFQTTVAKFKLTNRSERPLPVPVFQTEIASKDGYTYSGSRQSATALNIVPNASYVVSYSFALPASETGEGLRLSLYDKQTTGDYSYNSILASYQVAALSDYDDKLLKVYPFDVKVDDWSLSAQYSPMTGYNYKLKLFLGLTQDKQVLSDANSNKLEFDVFDSTDNMIGSTIKGFTGANRLQSGENNINLNATSEQLAFPVHINVYEVFTNENGETAKRLLTTFKQ
jgi:hypothetical protein